jgi:hypothetical protein
MANIGEMISSFKQWRRTRKRQRRWERFKGKGREEIFTTIFKENFWRSAESVSGSGSELKATELARGFIEGLVKELGIRSMLDVPCGDFNWMRQVELGECQYTGGDIVRPLVEENQAKHGRPGRSFVHMDITRDAIPRSDLILCRDCFIHLPYADISTALRGFVASGSMYLLTTTFPTTTTNVDVTGFGFRPLNLCAAPIGLATPMRILNERPEVAKEHVEFGKSLGLWRLDTIRV